MVKLFYVLATGVRDVRGGSDTLAVTWQPVLILQRLSLEWMQFLICLLCLKRDSWWRL